MIEKATAVLKKHLERLQQIEKEQEAVNGPEPDIESNSSNQDEGEEEKWIPMFLQWSATDWCHSLGNSASLNTSLTGLPHDP